MHQRRGCPLSGLFTHMVAAPLLPFFAFPNVDEGNAGMIHDLVFRLQLSFINILRDETSQRYGKAVYGKKIREA